MVNLKTRKTLNPVIVSAVVCAILIYSKILPLRTNNKLISLSPENSVTEISGTIASNPAQTSTKKYYSADFSVESVKNAFGLESSAKGNVKLFIPSEIAESHLPGKLYSAKGRLGDCLCEQGIRLKVSGNLKNGMFFAENAEKLEMQDNFFSKFLYFRALLRLQFRRIMFSWGAAGGLLLALLSGIKEYTESDVAMNFKNTGLSHILALSGMHLNLFSNMAKKACGVFLAKKTAFFIQFSAICFFVFFAGFSPSLLRAFICACITFALAVMKIKQKSMLFVLSASFLIHSSIKPDDVFHPAFLLSYSALAGILLLSECFNFFFITKIPEKISGSLSASTAAQFFTAPISLKIMGTFAPAGIIATMAVSPLITVFIYGGIILIVLCIIFPFFVPFSAFLMKILYNCISFLVSLFAKIPFFSISNN